MSWWERQWHKMLGGNVAVVGGISAATVTASNLTSGRIPFATTGGQLTDDGDLTFATDTLTATKVAAPTQARFGTGSNYTDFDSTGHQTLAGTAKPWEDMRIEPVARTTGANAPTFEKWFDDSAGTSRGVYLYSFDDATTAQEKEIFFTMQMPHAWDGGSISMHVHWVPFATVNSSECIWGLEYCWKEIGETFGDTVIVYSSGILVPDDTNITAGKHYISEFVDLVPGATADGLSSILIGRLFRFSGDASDTYTNKVGLLYIDAHYQISSLGSTDEYTK